MYSYGGQSDYLQALAEEEAARRQYAEATRAQEEARSRAARARLARQAYESAHSSYLSDEDDADDMLGGFARPGDGFGYPSRRQSAYGYPSIFDRQRAAALERERERERETLRLVEEERERRRRQLMELEEERRRRRLLEEEERRRFQLQREAEERERRRLEEDLLRRQQQSRESMFPLEDLFGLRLPRTAQSQDTPFSRRSRTMSPGKCARPMPPAASPSPVERTASRSPPRQQVPIHTPGSPAARPVPAQREQPNKPQSRQPPTEQEIDAATKIQSIWRRHRALRTIAEHAAKFAQLQKAFTLPSTLEYTAPGSSIHSHHHISVPVPSELSSLAEDGNEGQVPRLAYTPTNAPVHMYDEELARILTALDGIQSGGDDLVRKRRREAEGIC
ncbi:hypothetical protein BC835DRAFT_340371 [Cytidiella melzeri]|nr:hypothetical protein BC835DRAFT_340371 [Cytidiella melzeri]